MDKFLVENFDQKDVETRGGRYSNPRFLTEQGVAMLATILKSKVANKNITNLIIYPSKPTVYIKYNQNMLL